MILFVILSVSAPKMTRRKIGHSVLRRARTYEKRKAKAHRGRHLGKLGEPDYMRGDVPGEVKAWKNPMSRYAVKKEAQKGRKEIVSKSGVTEGAIRYVKRYRPCMKLFHRNKRVA